MAASEAQQFLNGLDRKLWAAADKLRASLDAAVYKHAVLGLIFFKYVSDSFAARRTEVDRLLRDPESDYYLSREDYDSDDEYEQAIHDELEDRDYYTEANIFWFRRSPAGRRCKIQRSCQPGRRSKSATARPKLIKCAASDC